MTLEPLKDEDVTVHGHGEGQRRLHERRTAKKPRTKAELEAENKHLRSVIDIYHAPWARKLVERTDEAGGTYYNFKHVLVDVAMAAFVQMLDLGNVKNVAEHSMTVEGKDVIVTLQRAGGKTPLDLYTEMKAERDALAVDRDNLWATIQNIKSCVSIRKTCPGFESNDEFLDELLGLLEAA